MQIPPIVIHEACLCWERDERELREAFARFMAGAQNGHRCGPACAHVGEIDPALGRFQSRFSVTRALTPEGRDEAIRLLLDCLLPALELVPRLDSVEGDVGEFFDSTRGQDEFDSHSLIVESVSNRLSQSGLTPLGRRQPVFVSKLAMIYRPDAFMPVDSLTLRATGLRDPNEYELYRRSFYSIAIRHAGPRDWNLGFALGHPRTAAWVRRYGPIPWAALVLRVIDKHLMFEAKGGGVDGFFTPIANAGTW